MSLNGNALVILHDVQHGDYWEIRSRLPEDELPSITLSFTDTFPDPNKYNGENNSRLKDEVFKYASILVIQKSLVEPPTPSVLDVLNSSFKSGAQKAGIFVFNNDYAVEPLQTQEVWEIASTMEEIK